jgi:hypothetical protein
VGAGMVLEKDLKQFLGLIDNLLNQILTASKQIDRDFHEFENLLKLILQTSFVESAVLEMVREPLTMLANNVKNLEATEKGYDELKNWSSFYFGSRMEEIAGSSSEDSSRAR